MKKLLPITILGLCLLLLYQVVDYSTAKYIDRVSASSVALSDEFYFTSNFLSEEKDDTKFSVSGWSGNDYTIGLEIRNYDNNLLYNSENVDVKYNLVLKVLYDDQDSLDESQFSINISKGGEVVLSTDDQLYLYDKGEIPGGMFNADTYIVQISKIAGADVAGKKIRFEIHATINENKNYTSSLMATFQLEGAEGGDFITHRELIKGTGKLYQYNIKTSQYSDGNNSGTRPVKIEWNPEKCTINEFNRTVFEIKLKNDPTIYKPLEGWIIVDMKSYSNVVLDFFLRGTTTELEETDFDSYINGSKD